MRLQERQDTEARLQIQYYMPKDPGAVCGAGANPNLLQTFTPDQFELLPGCLLLVTQKQLGNNRDRFTATLPPEAKCCFTYNSNTIQVSLGFEATPEEFLSYDKGVDPTTGKANWGAIVEPYRFRKRQNFAAEQ
jgi:hypothetical protein